MATAEMVEFISSKEENDRRARITDVPLLLLPLTLPRRRELAQPLDVASVDERERRRSSGCARGPGSCRGRFRVARRRMALNKAVDLFHPRFFFLFGFHPKICEAWWCEGMKEGDRGGLGSRDELPCKAKRGEHRWATHGWRREEGEECKPSAI